MKKENKVLMKEARESLKGKWGLAIGTFVVYGIIYLAISSISGKFIPLKADEMKFGGNIITILLAGPFALGVAIFSLSISRMQESKLEMIFEGFKSFGKALGAYLLVMIFVLLWSLILIIPAIVAFLYYSPLVFHYFPGESIGSNSILILILVFLCSVILLIPAIIASISYSQTFFIIADDNSISPMNAIKKSMQMMNGYKWKYFCLGLRFIGWVLLCIPTLFIGLLWVYPYMQISIAKFYDDVKETAPETIDY